MVTSVRFFFRSISELEATTETRPCQSMPDRQRPAVRGRRRSSVDVEMPTAGSSLLEHFPRGSDVADRQSHAVGLDRNPVRFSSIVSDDRRRSGAKHDDQHRSVDPIEHRHG